MCKTVYTCAQNPSKLSKWAACVNALMTFSWVLWYRSKGDAASVSTPSYSHKWDCVWFHPTCIQKAIRNRHTSTGRMTSPYVSVHEAARTKRSVFSSHSCSVGNLSWAHCPLLWKCSGSRCMLQSLPKKRFVLDDTWARVSSFRGNGERIGRGRWAPLNTTEEEERSIVHRLQVGGHRVLKSQYFDVKILYFFQIWLNFENLK